MSNDKNPLPEEGEQLADFLSDLHEERLEQLTFYDGDEPIASLQKRMPHLRVMSKESLKVVFYHI